MKESEKYKLEQKTVGERTYIEHARILKSLAIGRHPLIPRDRLTPFKDFLYGSIQPTSRWRSREFPEGRFGVSNLIFDEGGRKDKERCCKKRQRKEEEHCAWD